MKIVFYGYLNFKKEENEIRLFKIWSDLNICITKTNLLVLRVILTIRASEYV